jgi:hypothetical protein
MRRSPAVSPRQDRRQGGPPSHDTSVRHSNQLRRDELPFYRLAMIACYGLPVETRGRSSCSVGSRSFGRGILVRQLEDRRSSAAPPRDRRRQGPELKLGRHELMREPACPPARRDRICMQCGSVVGQHDGKTSETRTLKRQKKCHPLLFSQHSANPHSWG